MGIREQAYWLRQADALKRQRVAEMAHAVCIGMADPKERQKAIDDLELSETREESREKQSQATWDMLYMIGGSRGV